MPASISSIASTLSFSDMPKAEFTPQIEKSSMRRVFSFCWIGNLFAMNCSPRSGCGSSANHPFATSCIVSSHATWSTGIHSDDSREATTAMLSPFAIPSSCSMEESGGFTLVWKTPEDWAHPVKGKPWHTSSTIFESGYWRSSRISFHNSSFLSLSRGWRCVGRPAWSCCSSALSWTALFIHFFKKLARLDLISNGSLRKTSSRTSLINAGTRAKARLGCPISWASFMKSAGSLGIPRVRTSKCAPSSIGEAKVFDFLLHSSRVNPQCNWRWITLVPFGNSCNSFSMCW